MVNRTRSALNDDANGRSVSERRQRRWCGKNGRHSKSASHRGIEHLDPAAESSFSVAFGLIGLHLPHRRLARIDKFQLDRGLAENADDGGLFAAAPDAVIVRSVGDAPHEAA
jgi:hypothetical protein